MRTYLFFFNFHYHFVYSYTDMTVGQFRFNQTTHIGNTDSKVSSLKIQSMKIFADELYFMFTTKDV